jgi:thioesterase domain-containing protein
VPEISTSSTTELLTQIWQRVLRLSTIRVEDNFFELGGDSILALQLFAEIAEVCGQQLPPVLIYHAPTIAAQAVLMEQPAARGFSPLVPLKVGSDQSPVFIAPGLGGGPAEFFHLVKHIRTPRGIYGLQPRGMDGLGKPAADIHDMAEFYLGAIQQLQSRGPYFLLGYSLGGLVALEMARRLSYEREEIGLLVMLDSYPHISFLPHAQRVKLQVQRLRWRITSSIRGRTSIRPRVLNPRQVTAFAPGMDIVKDCAFSALQTYRPRFYDGKIRFVRAETVSDFPPDPAVIWGPLSGKFTVESVPGDHLEMLTLHYPELGSVLTRYLEEASQPKDSGKK